MISESVSDLILDWSKREEGEALEATPIEKGANADLFLTMDGRENQRSGTKSFARSKQLSTKELLGFSLMLAKHGGRRDEISKRRSLRLPRVYRGVTTFVSGGM